MDGIIKPGEGVRLGVWKKELDYFFVYLPKFGGSVRGVPFFIFTRISTAVITELLSNTHIFVWLDDLCYGHPME